MKGRSPSRVVSLIRGNGRNCPSNCPPEILAPIHDCPSCVTIIRIPLHSPSLGLRLRKRIIGAPTFKDNFDGGSEAQSKLCKNSAGICSAPGKEFSLSTEFIAS